MHHSSTLNLQFRRPCHIFRPVPKGTIPAAGRQDTAHAEHKRVDRRSLFPHYPAILTIEKVVSGHCMNHLHIGLITQQKGGSNRQQMRITRSLQPQSKQAPPDAYIPRLAETGHPPYRNAGFSKLALIAAPPHKKNAGRKSGAQISSGWRLRSSGRASPESRPSAEWRAWRTAGPCFRPSPARAPSPLRGSASRSWRSRPRGRHRHPFRP